MPNYDDFAAQLSVVTEGLGEIMLHGEGESATVVMRVAGSRTLMFEGTLRDLYRAVEATDATGLYSDEEASSLTGRLKLFSVHLEEALETAPRGARYLEYRSFGLVAVQPRSASHRQ